MPKQSSYFLDTNILVYAFEQRESEKRNLARRLIDDSNPWETSWQVIQEFCSLALHRFKTPLPVPYLESLLDLLIIPHCTVFPDASIWRSTLRIQKETQYRFYDSLIVAAALQSGAPVLYTEDLQHGRKIADLEIRNPFVI